MTEPRRFAWEQAFGAIPDRRAVTVMCENQLCVNPKHLALRAWYDPVARFWEKVDKTPTCWIWRGTKVRSGYGQHRLDVTVAIAAHRFSYELHYGKITGHVAGDPELELCVCHTCDNPSCVNPEHLFVGTDKDNIHDMIRKGRASWQKAKVA